ncbi:hypothetical protein [uncultured Desulfobulbus sp.]|nr:hypothetical protein [uncultured Desulfobulbus sp.]
MTKTILIAGATGYIGRSMEKALRLLVRNAKKLTSKTPTCMPKSSKRHL